MSVDIKTILLVILIIVIIGVIIFFALRILNSSDYEIENDNNVESNYIEEKYQNEENFNTNIETENEITGEEEFQNRIGINQEENENNFSNEDLTKVYGTGLDINNYNPTKNYENYNNKTVALTGGARLTYSVPYNWDSSTNGMVSPDGSASLEAGFSKTSSFIEEVYKETTYEEVLDAFMEREADEADSDEISFSQRELITDSGSFNVIVMEDEETVTSYIVFIRGLFEYHLKFECYSDDYNENMIDIIDKIFSSFKVL